MARSESSRKELETRLAWAIYLETCRRADDYESVEPYAWARLVERLGEILSRKKR